MSVPHSAPMLEARSRAYGLMARLLLRGIDDVAWSRISDLPELFSGVASLDRDELAAEHHTTFHLGAFPYAGAFLSEEAKAGGLADLVRRHYAAAGFSPRLDEVSADHLGVMLAYLSFVTGAQADAVEDGKPAIADRLDRNVGEFLEEALLSWVPSLLVAIDARGSKFWSNVVGMCLGLAADHRAHLRQPHRPTTLPPCPSPLEDERTGLRDVAEFLLTPARSGVFLTRGDIGRLGRRHDVPRGFGSRVTMLTNLLRSAVDLGELPPLLDTLDDLLLTRIEALETVADALGLHGHVAPWCRRIKTTRGIVLELADHARKGDESWKSKPSTMTQPAP